MRTLGHIHRKLGILEQFLAAVRLRFRQRDADRDGEKDFALVERDGRPDRLADGLREGNDAVGIPLRHENQTELVSGKPRQRVLRLEQAAQPARQRQQDRVPDRHPDRIIDLFEAVEVHDHHGRADRRIGLAERQQGFEPVDEQMAVRQPREIVVNRIMQQALFGDLGVGDVGQRSDEPHHFAIRAYHRPRFHGEPQRVTVGRAQPEILDHATAPLLHHAIKGSAKPVTVKGMEYVDPLRRRTLECPALEAHHRLGFRAGIDLVGRYVPVPDQVAGPGKRERAALHVGDKAVGDAARESMLHDREPDQHDDQHEAAQQRRRDDVVRHPAVDGETGGQDPQHQQKPGRDQQDGTIEALRRKVNDDGEARDGDEQQRQAGDAGGDRGIDKGDRHQSAQKGKPGNRHMGIANVPAVEIEIGEQEHQQGCGQNRLAGCPPHPFGPADMSNTLPQKPKSIPI